VLLGNLLGSFFTLNFKPAKGLWYSILPSYTECDAGINTPAFFSLRMKLGYAPNASDTFIHFPPRGKVRVVAATDSPAASNANRLSWDAISSWHYVDARRHH